MYNQKPEKESFTSLTCPLCNKEVSTIAFGGRFVGVCCSEIVYIGDYPDGAIRSDTNLQKYVTLNSNPLNRS